MRVVFMGNHNMGVVCLQRLIDIGEDVVCVVAHPDNYDPHENVWYDSVKELALKHRIVAHQPQDVNAPEFVDVLKRFEPDVIVVVSFRQILKKSVITVPKLGVVNVHPSLLPKYRGRANIAWAIINGETKTGVTVHYIDEKIDTGPIIVQNEIDIGPEDTVATVLDRVTDLYPDVLAEALQKVKEGFKGTAQDPSQASYYGRRYPKDGLINWNHPAPNVHNLVRAVTHPYPGAFTYLNNRRLFIWESAFFDHTEHDNHETPGKIVDKIEGKGFVVSTGRGRLLAKKVQYEGDQELDAWSFFQKEHLQLGTALASSPSEGDS